MAAGVVPMMSLPSGSGRRVPAGSARLRRFHLCCPRRRPAGVHRALARRRHRPASASTRLVRLAGAGSRPELLARHAPYRGARRGRLRLRGAAVARVLARRSPDRRQTLGHHAPGRLDRRSAARGRSVAGRAGVSPCAPRPPSTSRSVTTQLAAAACGRATIRRAPASPGPTAWSPGRRIAAAAAVGRAGAAPRRVRAVGAPGCPRPGRATDPRRRRRHGSPTSARVRARSRSSDRQRGPRRRRGPARLRHRRPLPAPTGPTWRLSVARHPHLPARRHDAAYWTRCSRPSGSLARR